MESVVELFQAEPTLDVGCNDDDADMFVGTPVQELEGGVLAEVQELSESVVEVLQADPKLDDDGSHDDDADVFVETTVEELEVDVLAEIQELATEVAVEGLAEVLAAQAV